MDNTVCGRCSVSQKKKLKDAYLKKYILIFRHLKLEIALAIPASNEWKIQ